MCSVQVPINSKTVQLNCCKSVGITLSCQGELYSVPDYHFDEKGYEGGGVMYSSFTIEELEKLVRGFI
jgi:hypothetical protein